MIISIDPTTVPDLRDNNAMQMWQSRIWEYARTGDKARLPPGVTVVKPQRSMFGGGE